jgi:hypothetical protein
MIIKPLGLALKISVGGVSKTLYFWGRANLSEICFAIFLMEFPVRTPLIFFLQASTNDHVTMHFYFLIKRSNGYFPPIVEQYMVDSVFEFGGSSLHMNAPVSKKYFFRFTVSSIILTKTPCTFNHLLTSVLLRKLKDAYKNDPLL